MRGNIRSLIGAITKRCVVTQKSGQIQHSKPRSLKVVGSVESTPDTEPRATKILEESPSPNLGSMYRRHDFVVLSILSHE